jgi:cholesterol oxidase
MGGWTRVVGDAGQGNGFLCLLGYDQPEGGLGEFFVVASGSWVDPADIDTALGKLDEHMAGTLWQKVLHVARRPARAMAALGAGPAPVSLTLAFASCQYPSGLMDGVPAQASLQRLAELLALPQARHPERLLLLGDQIYADATAGLLDPIRLDDRYRVPYEELSRMESFRSVTAQIPVSWMLDDHENVDNWEPDLRDSRADLLQRGVAAYWTHQRKIAPQATTWYSTGGSGWHLFMADTRTRRELRCEATLATASILGEPQVQALENWLQQCPPQDLKLVASPAMLLPRLVEHLDEPLHLDGWQGYPASLHRLLAFLCEAEIANVCFLSGDAHLGCDVAITIIGPGGKTAKTRSIHTPALYAPLPFANEHLWNLKLPQDSFRFPDAALGPYTCSVEGTVQQSPRDGCSLLEADRNEAGWAVNIRLI